MSLNLSVTHLRTQIACYEQSKPEYRWLTRGLIILEVKADNELAFSLLV